jgi:putative addiction module antidote
MVLEIKLRKIGNSVGVVLPKEALAHLNLREGDKVCVTEAADGSLRLAAANNAEFSRQMEIAKDVLQRYRNTLRELAK